MDVKAAEQLDTRKKLLEIIRAKPGIHFRELHRESGLAMGELEYHLGVLEKNEIITKTKSPHYTKYYPTAELGSKDKKLMDILRHKKLREILLFIISKEKVSHGDIVAEFQLIKSTASFYADKLLKYGLIEKQKEGRNVYYTVKNPMNVLRLLLLYKKGFGEELAERVEGLWGNL
ncbi:MAG: winged helix-turn-helix transcriptional regulator [Thermoplasmata archaeon]|nr:MAG: winged helix-turn-helix transcriptional regulator [Thermoplasmata archaeon]